MISPLDFIATAIRSTVPAADLAVCVSSGSRAYGLGHWKSDWDLLGIHFMNKDDFLQHPDFRKDLSVIRKQYNHECKEVFDRKSEVSLDSFEWWKFINLWLKGSFVTQELLNFPSLISAPSIPGFQETLDLMKYNSSSKIGHAARGNTMHDWAKDRTNRKKTVMAYYRLIQALKFLQTQEFISNTNQLKIWYEEIYQPIPGFTEVLNIYKDENFRKEPVSQILIEKTSLELSELMVQVDRSLITTKLPDRVSKGVLEKVLQNSQSIRMFLIES